MDNSPSDADRNLLNRLNALKASSVRLDRQRTPLDFRSSSPAGVENAHDLVTRFKSLKFSPDISSLDDPTGLFESTDVIDSLLTNLDSCQDLQEKLHAEERSVQEGYESTDVNVSRSAANLLKGVPVHDQGGDKIIADSTIRLPVNDTDDIETDQEADDQIAAQYLEDILKEAEIPESDETALESTTTLKSSPTGSDEQPPVHVQRPDKMTSPSSTSNPDQSFELPSVSALPRLPVTEDTDLTARFAALSLPSVPPHLPAQTRSLLPTDQVGSSGCCICSDNAVTRCLDCEGLQLYCMRCWWEMHLEEGADWELRQHRSVKYTSIKNEVET